MKITRTYLGKIINEELSRVLLEFDKIDDDDEDPGAERDGDGEPGEPLEEGEDEDCIEEGGDWIQQADKDIEKRGTEGKCTPITKPGCTGQAKALAKTFKKMGRERKEK